MEQSHRLFSVETKFITLRHKHPYSPWELENHFHIVLRVRLIALEIWSDILGEFLNRSITQRERYFGYLEISVREPVPILDFGNGGCVLCRIFYMFHDISTRLWRRSVIVGPKISAR